MVSTNKQYLVAFKMCNASETFTYVYRELNFIHYGVRVLFNKESPKDVNDRGHVDRTLSNSKCMQNVRFDSCWLRLRSLTRVYRIYTSSQTCYQDREFRAFLAIRFLLMHLIISFRWQALHLCFASLFGQNIYNKRGSHNKPAFIFGCLFHSLFRSILFVSVSVPKNWYSNGWVWNNRFVFFLSLLGRYRVGCVSYSVSFYVCVPKIIAEFQQVNELRCTSKSAEYSTHTIAEQI